MEDVLRETYWLNVANMHRYSLIMTFRRLKHHACLAPISYANLFYSQPNLYKLRAVHSRVQWSKITSHGRNSFIYQASWLYNSMELNGEYFKNMEKFKGDIKFRLFTRFENGNI